MGCPGLWVGLGAFCSPLSGIWMLVHRAEVLEDSSLRGVYHPEIYPFARPPYLLVLATRVTRRGIRRVQTGGVKMVGGGNLARGGQLLGPNLCLGRGYRWSDFACFLVLWASGLHCVRQVRPVGDWSFVGGCRARMGDSGTPHPALFVDCWDRASWVALAAPLRASTMDW